MARKPKSISIYEQIENVQLEIKSTEETLSLLKSQLENLLEEKDELEMRQIWSEIKESGLSIEDVQKLLNKTK